MHYEAARIYPEMGGQCIPDSYIQGHSISGK